MGVNCVALCMQLRIEAGDGGEPPCTISTVVVVSVTRNLQQPRFNQAEYTVDILETHDLETVVTTVQATDSDERVKCVVLLHVGKFGLERVTRKLHITTQNTFVCTTVDTLVLYLYKSQTA